MALLSDLKTLTNRISKEIAEGKFDLKRFTRVFASIPAGTGAPTVAALKQNVELLTGQNGSVLDKALTLRDLMNEGSLAVVVGDQVIGGENSGSIVVPANTNSDPFYVDPRPVLSTAPTPENLTATATFRSVFLEWELVDYQNHGGVEIWRNGTDNLGTAVKIGQTTANLYVDGSVQSGVSYYYWVRAFLESGDPGAYNAVSGTLASPQVVGGVDLGPLIVAAGNIANGAIDIGGTKVTGTITNPAMFGAAVIGSAAIQNGAITNALIANAAIDDAKIDNLSAAKITFGTMSGDRIGVGTLNADRITVNTITGDRLVANTVTADKINGNSLIVRDAAGNAIFGTGVQFDGGTYIQDGTINNAKIGSFIQSTNYVAGVSGWKIDKTGFAELRNVTVTGSITANAVNAASGTLGDITGGTLHNAANTTYINLNATGTSLLLRAGSFNGTTGHYPVEIQADGTAYLEDLTVYKNVASGVWDAGTGVGAGILVYYITGGTVTIAEREVAIDTGVTVPYFTLASRSYTARLHLERTHFTWPGSAPPSGVVISRFQVSGTVTVRTPHYRAGSAPSSGEDYRLFIFARVQSTDVHGSIDSIWAQRISWALDFVP